MTIAATITAKQYTGNGVTTQFAFPNKIFAASDLLVTIIDNLGNQYPFVNFANATLGLTYTVQGVDVDTGAIVVLSGPLTNLWSIDIRSLIPDLQSTSIKNQGSFFPELHEEAFDRATRMIQDLLRLSYLYGIHGPDIEAAPWPALPGIAARKGMALMFDASTGLPTLGVPNTQTITTGLLAPFLNLATTSAEAAAATLYGITIFNQYAYGALRRYGADPIGIADSQASVLAACKCNSLVFDDYPGGGQYRIKTLVTLTTFPLTFQGQAKSNNDVTGNVGSVFIIDAALGAGGAAFATAYIDNLNFKDWGFKFATGGNAQFAFRVMTISGTHGQLRSSTFERCAFVGTGPGDTNGALRIDSGVLGSEYSGFNVFDKCYFTGLLAPIRCTGNFTPNAITNCSFLGYTGSNAVNSLGAITPGSLYTNGTYANVPLTGGAGTGAVAHIQVTGGAVTQVVLVGGGSGYAGGNVLSAAAANIGGTGSGFSIPVATAGAQGGVAIQIDYPGVEAKIGGKNYFEGFIVGVHSNGAATLLQEGNDYQVCTYGYVWIQTTYTVINNQSIGETGVAGVALGYSSLDASQIQQVGRFGWLATGGAIQSTRGFQEGQGSGTNLRAQLLGYGASPGVVMAANGGATISAQTTTTWSVSYVGGHVYLDFEISATLTGAGATALLLPLPVGVSPVVATQVPCFVTNGGSTAVGIAYVNALGANLQIGLGATGSANFTAGAVAANGQIRIRILS